MIIALRYAKLGMWAALLLLAHPGCGSSEEAPASGSDVSDSGGDSGAAADDVASAPEAVDAAPAAEVSQADPAGGSEADTSDGETLPRSDVSETDVPSDPPVLCEAAADGMLPTVCRIAVAGTDIDTGTFEEFAPALPFLDKHQLNVGIAVGSLTDLEEVEAIVLALDELGLMAVLQPFLSQEDGVYANVDNADVFLARFREIRDWVIDRELPITWFVFDLEPARGGFLTTELPGLLESDPDAAWAWVEERIADPRFSDTLSDFAAMVDELHEGGFKVMGTPLPIVLDDEPGGPDTLQRLLGTPVYGVDWDLLGAQIYGSGVPFGPAFVYSYTQSAVDRFGDRAAVGLGLVGSGTYEDYDAYLGGVAAARATGVAWGRTYLFELAGILELEDLDKWIPPRDLEPVVPDADAVVDLMRDLLGDISDDGGVTDENKEVVGSLLGLLGGL